MLIRWSLFVFRHAWLIICAGLVAVLVGAAYGSSVFHHVETNGQDFQDPGSVSATYTSEYGRHFPNTQGQFIVLFSSTSARVDDPAYRNEVTDFTALVGQLPHVTDITDFYAGNNPTFNSTDRHDTFVSVSAAPAYQDQIYDRLVSMTAFQSGPAEMKLGGSAVINKQVNDQVELDLKKAEVISFPILGVLLFLFFGSLVSATVPLCLGGLSIIGALCIMRLLTDVTTISSYAINVVTLLGLGLAIDYSLFMVGRFREELRKHDDVEVALAIAVGRSGRTILLSGLMVAISLLSLLVFPQTFLRSIGLGGAAVVATTVIIALTMLPAALRLLGHRVNALPIFLKREDSVEIPSYRFWYQFSEGVMRWAQPVFVITLVSLLLVANQFRHAKLSTTDIATVPETLSSRQVNDTLEQKFTGFSSEPITLLIREPVVPMSQQGLSFLRQYTTSLWNIPGVASVDSILTADPQIAAGPAPIALSSRYVSGDYVAMTVRLSTPPQSSAARQALESIRAVPAATGSSVLTGGVTAQLTDLLHSLRKHLPAALAVVGSATFLLVFLLTGSVILPIKAILLDLLSLFTALGILAWVFQFQHLSSFIPLTTIGSVDATATVLIFAIAFGLSADYEFFLLSRVKEEYDTTSETTHSIAYGIQRTAGIITAAALLFVSVIGLFMMSKATVLQQVGLGLSAAIVIDATIIRLMLVAATMRILGRLNWWAPRPLRYVYQKIGGKFE